MTIKYLRLIVYNISYMEHILTSTRTHPSHITYTIIPMFENFQSNKYETAPIFACVCNCEKVVFPLTKWQNVKISGKKPNTSLMLSEKVARKSEAAEKRPITFWQVKFVCVCVYMCVCLYKKAPYHHFIHAEYFLVYSSSLLFSSIVFALITHMIRLIGRTCVHFVTSI